MIISLRNRCWRHVSRTHRVDLDCQFGRMNLENSVSNIAFATVQCKSLMRLFDIHPPQQVNVKRSASESSCPAVSSIPASHVERVQLPARLRSQPWGRKDGRILTPNFQSEPRLWKPTAFYGTRRIEPRQFLVRSMPRYEARKDKRHKGRVSRCIEEKVLNNGPPLKPRCAKDRLLQGSDGIRFPDRSVHLGHPRAWIHDRSFDAVHQQVDDWKYSGSTTLRE